MPYGRATMYFQRLLYRPLRVIGLGWLCLLATDRPLQHPAHDATAGPPSSYPVSRSQAYLQKYQDPATGQLPVAVRQQELAYARALVKQYAYRGEDLALVSKGPVNLGGRTRALGTDVRNADVLLAGGVSGGMWRSTDGGQHWTATTRPDQLPSVSCLVQDVRPGHEDTWYYGTGEIFGNTASSVGAPFRGDGVFKSVDNGQSWEQIEATATQSLQRNRYSEPFNHINGLALDPSNSREAEVYAAVPYGIVRSTDGFATYETVLGGPVNGDNGRWTEVMTTANGMVYASISNEKNQPGQHGIFRSTNGINWENITPNTGYAGAFRRIVMAAAPSRPNVLYFLGDTPTGPRLHRYSATTDTWTDLTLNLPAYGGLVGNFDTQDSYNMVVAVHPQSPDTVLVGGTNLYLSTKGFADRLSTRWIGGYAQKDLLHHYPEHHADQHALVFDARGQLVSAHDGGLSVTADLFAPVVTWQSLNRGYQTAQVYGVGMNVLDVNDPRRLAGMQDNGTYALYSPRNTQKWEPLSIGDGGYCALSPNSLVVSRQYGRLQRYPVDLRTGQGAGESKDISPPEAGQASEYRYTTPWVLDPVRINYMFLAGQAGLWVNANITHPQAESLWRLIPDTPLTGNLSALTISASSSQLWVGTDQGKVYRVDNHLQQELTFEDLTGKNFPEGAYVSSVAVHPTRPAEVWVCFSNYGVESLFRSTDGGKQWQPVGGNLEQVVEGEPVGPAINWVALLDQGQTTHHFLATSVGLFYTDRVQDTATQWLALGPEELGMAPIDHLQTNSAEGTVLIGAHGKGVYELKVPALWQPRAVLAGPDPLCETTNTTLLASRLLGSQPDVQYQWYRNGEWLEGDTAALLHTSEPGTYRAALSRPDQPQAVYTNPVVLWAPVPDSVTLSQVGNQLVVNPTCQGCQYIWRMANGERLTITQEPYLQIDRLRTTNSYQVEVVNGCQSVQSNRVEVQGFQARPGQLVVIPNPVRDFAELRILDGPQQVTGARLVTLKGQEVARQEGIRWDWWDLSQLPRGQYLMQVWGPRYQSATLLIKE